MQTKFIGATRNEVQFMLGTVRVVAFADGEVKAFDDESVTDVDVTDDMRNIAHKMLKKHLKAPFTFKGRAMTGRGRDS